MILTITTTHAPATDLGFLLHKHPGKVQAFPLSFGQVHVFYPEASGERCTAALMLDVDPVALVRRRGGPAGEAFSLQQYVNDRPYVASSMMAVAIAQVFGTALAGHCKSHPELATTPIPLTARIAAIPCRGAIPPSPREGAGGGLSAEPTSQHYDPSAPPLPHSPREGAGGGLSAEPSLHLESAQAADPATFEPPTLLARLFEPLGYTVRVTRHALDDRFPDWGASSIHTVELAATKTLTDLLSHLYVLIPVLDNEKHYWVGDEEVDKLLRHGEGWLASHPLRDLIARRYLKHRRNLADEAIDQLRADEAIARLREQDGETEAAVSADAPDDPREAATEESLSLHEQRHGVILSVLAARGARRVIDLGCGEGRLLRELLKHMQFEKITGMDVSHRSLEIAADRLRLDRLPPTQRQRIELLHGSLMYRDKRLERGGALAGESGFDAAVLCEVIEHLDEPRLSAMERVVFEFARPPLVIVTTPNAEYNVLWQRLPAGAMRHRDHRFEWTREQFQAWARGVAQRFGYEVSFLPVGTEDASVGAPTQMGLFALDDRALPS